MSETFQRALDWVLQRVKEGKDLAYIQASFPVFRDGGLTINRVVSVDPVLLGYFDEKLKLKINENVVRSASLVAKLRGFDLFASPPEIRIVKDGVIRGVLREDGFAASDALLFREIATKVYGLGGAAIMEMPVKDSWPNSLARLLSDRGFVETIFFIALLILLPPTLAALSLLVTPSRFVPDPLRIGVAAAILFVSFYLGRLYVREQLRQRQR
ncbi:MAG: hypothetical protein RMJ28_03220 [Nitrososphaerota archaeon]|nr:hypothetical protein [Candidatus Calditenuaceae archaeon]MDW8073231.1 hypothetical protein [Nitrososphaerota archaeon]